MDISLEEEKTSDQIRSELSNMSFEELQKLKESLGAKVYNEAVFGVGDKRKLPRKKNEVFKRANKNRPREMSSKRQVPIVRDDAPVKKESTVRDPRFDPSCGTFNLKGFERSFSFVQDIRQNELKELKNELKNTTDPERAAQIKYLIQRIENQNREKKRRDEKEAKEYGERSQRTETVKEGKKPIFVKKSEKKVLDLVEKYESLKASGQLEKHITKYRKKNTQKAKKKMSF